MSASGVRLAFGVGVEVAGLGAAMESFLLVGCLGKSLATKKWYRERLERFIEWRGDVALGNLQEADLLHYVAGLEGVKLRYAGGVSRPEVRGGLSKWTIHGHVRALRTWCKWLKKTGLVDVDLGGRLPLPKLPKRGQAGVADGDLVRLLEAAKGNARDYALLLFLADTGARRAGAAGLRLGDIDLDNPNPRLARRARVIEKGDKQRTVIMTVECVEALRRWLAERPRAAGCDAVFLAMNGGKVLGPLSPDSVSQIFRRYRERLGIVGPASPHQLRHRFARNMLENGMDLSQVSQLMGHEDVSITVKYYGQFGVDRLQAAYDEAKKNSE